MRRIAIVVGSLLGSMLLLAGPAQATYHLNKVNEVMLASGSGDGSVQFVEFVDHGGATELFTPLFAPYRLVIYDAGADVLGTQTLDPNKLRAAALAGREYLVSSAAADAAFHVAGDERLTVTLPDAQGADFLGAVRERAATVRGCRPRGGERRRRPSWARPPARALPDRH